MNAAEEKNRPIRSQPFEGLESPFLDEELFTTKSEENWEAHLALLEAESPFPSAFEQLWAFAGAGEMESAEAFEDQFAFEEPGIIRGDNRLRIRNTTGVPWRWICKIVIEDSRGRPVGNGTGVLISVRHVLTAAHVVYNAYKNMHQYTITVIPAFNDLTEPFGSYAITQKPKICKEYSPTAADSLDWDYALLTLRTAIGKKPFPALNGSPLCYWGSPRCGANTVFARLDARTLNGKAAYTAGYAGGKGGKQLWYAAGILHSADERRRTMWTTVDTTGGQSGSPVWVIDNKRYCLVGVAVGAGKGSNRVVRVTRELIHQLRTWIAEDGETPSIVEREGAMESPTLTLSYPQAEHYGLLTAKYSSELAGEEAEDFISVDYEEDELEVLHEQPVEERFDPTAVPKDVADALSKKDWRLALKLAIQAGWRDESALTNLIFFARHDELPKEKLEPEHPKFKQLRAEWTKILTSEVRPAIHQASEDIHLIVSGKYVAERDPQFSGETGKKFKELVEWAAREVDINPGLLAAVLLAEWDKSSLYLSSGEVRSFLSGTDDFFAQSKQLAESVPAYSKVRFDATKKTTNINEHGRLVTTIPFKSGKDAALATAVYLKYGEFKLRKGAQTNGGDFDKLPIETQFALVRIAMTAGHGGIGSDGALIRFKKKKDKNNKDKWVPVKKGEKGGVLLGVASRLHRVLKGEDILVRKNEPRKYPSNGHITNRNATILVAQAMHLSDWMFGIPVLAAAAQPEQEAFEDFDDAEFGDDEFEQGRMSVLEQEEAAQELFWDEFVSDSANEFEEYYAGELEEDAGSGELFDSWGEDEALTETIEFSEDQFAEQDDDFSKELEEIQESGEFDDLLYEPEIFKEPNFEHEEFEDDLERSYESEGPERRPTPFAHMAFDHILLESIDPVTSALVPGVVPATPKALTTPFFDATVAGTNPDPVLQQALTNLINSKAPYRNAGRNIAISLVDLSGSSKNSPKYAGFNDRANFYGASVNKIMGLLGVYQLLAEANELLKAKPAISDAVGLESELKALWIHAGIAAQHHPLVTKILAVHPGSPPTATIRPELTARLDRISTGNQNGSAPIVLLRFPFIGSTMLAHGLFSPVNSGGLWIRKAYGKTEYLGQQLSISDWSASENPHPRTAVHNVNAVSVAQFYTLAAQRRMIDAATSKAVLRHLQTGGCTTEIDATSLYASGQVSTKCGIFNGWVHNSIHFKETATLREFVVVILTKNYTFRIMKDLFKDLVALIP